ncbi:WapI family immunity protein [Albibacillus kandeliae]|uniref:WapI family immunity protein n=1 Tax=Albibacillus kandeliae TaxID=2174228 RepID=UPI000D6972CD|nr:hypothetical protein [Albibacillus kandeliae]
MSLARIGDLTLRARKYEFPDGSDYFDRNWLNISVTLSGGAEPLSYQWPCLLTTDLRQFRDRLSVLLAGLADTASLDSMEPHIYVVMSRAGSGSYSAQLSIRDLADREHQRSTDLSPTDVLALRNQLDEIIALFPERDGGEV